MVRRTLLVAATAVAVLTGINCNPNAGSIFPMTIGSVWHRESYLLEGPSMAALDTFETSVTTTTAFEKVRLINGKEVVKFKGESAVHLRAPDSTYTTNGDTLLGEEEAAILFYDALEDTTGDTVMMSSPAVGQSWSTGPATSIIMDQEDVTVAAGTYKKAWKVKTITNIGGVTVELYSWYARGVGRVKMHGEGEYQGYAAVYHEELTAATIK